MSDLSVVAQALVASYKGILAADESSPTIKKRFDSVGIEDSHEARKAYRELLFTTPKMEQYISGVICFDETLQDGLGDHLQDKGVLVGIKVDTGTVEINDQKEKITLGLDNSAARLTEYVKMGVNFAKWRAIFKIGPDTPSQSIIEANAHSLAQYARLCQMAGVVPIVEPEVLMDGDHDLSRCEDISRAVLTSVFTALQDYKVDLAGMLLKPNMVVAGKDCPSQSTPEEVAESTHSMLQRCVPQIVPGIVFLSGGMSPETASTNLNAICQKDNVPWDLSFSFGRALQEPVLQTWLGRQANVTSAQKVFLHRCKMNWLARQGKYTPEAEKED